MNRPLHRPPVVSWTAVRSGVAGALLALSAWVSAGVVGASPTPTTLQGGVSNTPNCAMARFDREAMGCGFTIAVGGGEEAVPNPQGGPTAIGIVTVSPEPPMLSTIPAGVYSGVSSFNGQSGCMNLTTQYLVQCAAGSWMSPVTVTLTAHPLQQGESGRSNRFLLRWVGRRLRQCRGLSNLLLPVAL